MCCPLLCAAQSEWETPNAQKPTQSTTLNRGTTSDKNTTNPKATKVLKDAKYLQDGIVPEKDGKIVFSHNIDIKGKTVAEIYDNVYATLDSIAKEDDQINSGIALINRKEHIIAAQYSEWLTFSKTFISVDRTKFNYTIIARCSDGHLSLTLERISYDYDEQRSTGYHATAEEMIADSKAVNKKHTKLIFGPAKFRRSTIDRIEQIFAFIDNSLSHNANTNN